MRTFAMNVVLARTIVAAGCGATRKVASAVAPGAAVTGATITFIDRDHGKDAKSAVDVWLLRSGRRDGTPAQRRYEVRRQRVDRTDGDDPSPVRPTRPISTTVRSGSG